MPDSSGCPMTYGTKPDWYQATSKYAQPNLRKSLLQLADTLIPYLSLWALMVYTMHKGYSYWITLGLTAIAAALYIRIFIFFHDTCHGSFFASSRANTILGYITGILTFTPYENWRRTHAIHHSTVGDLDRRGVGDVWTMTAEEYLAAPIKKRISYRLFRNPFIMFGIGPVFMFLISNRFSSKVARKSERKSVILTNLAILAIIAAISLSFGFRTYLLIQLPIILIAGIFGVWLFYVQHQFDGVYWARHEDWDHMKASLEGSSYYRLPKILQWITGNIGLHHIHHVRPLIPNYNLQQCYDDIPELQAVKPLTLRKSLRSLFLNLYDEKRKKLVPFKTLK